MFILYIIILLASCFVLIKSGTWLVRSLAKISHILGWSEFWVSFYLMAFATSLPEFSIGISSALHKVSQLSFGNIIGANMLNLTLGIGLAVILAKGINLNSQTMRKGAIYSALLAVLPLLLLLNGEVSRIDGVILVLALVCYSQVLSKQSKKFSRTFSENFKEKHMPFKVFLKNLAVFFVSIFLLLLSAEGVVRSINFLTVEFGFSLVIAGTLFVSVGTTLPELVFGARAISLGHKQMALGNLLGSVALNSTLILGIVSIISPLKVNDFSPYIIGMLFTSFAALLLLLFSKSGRKISPKQAFILLGLYILFVVTQFIIG